MMHSNHCALLLSTCLFAGILSACGGGGGGASTYGIGGTVSGLSASGLVLLDNGGDALSVAANATSFTFASALANGSAYAVTVQTQPTGQTCSLSNGSGTISSANVTSVAVTCSAGAGAKYTIGGSVTGLTGSGLVLLDNGGDALTVQPSSSSFQFATSVATGSAYAITVQTQPSGASCSVSKGGGTVASANVTTASVTCTFNGSGPNQVAVSVNPGPASAKNQIFNDLLVSVVVCTPGSSSGCVTVNNVLVDTGSEGLRLMKSALTSAGLTLTALADPNSNANTIHECLPFVDGYTWGAVALAGIKLGSESVASIAVQVIDDSQTPAPAAPASCTSNGSALNSVDAFDGNGVLGIGPFLQDCGGGCVLSAGAHVYYSCTGAGACTATTLPLADQVANPVAGFVTDNNGVIVQLPTIAATGAATASGYLVFGIGTESNNMLGSATILTTSPQTGYFTTTYSGQTLPNSFIDSGSNAPFFPDSSIPKCGDAAAFYCPGSSSSLSSATLSATNQGANGTMSTVQFQIANLDYLAANDGSNFALNDVGGPAASSKQVSSYFDWGMPFFYGRTIYVAIEGAMAGGSTGPYYAY